MTDRKQYQRHSRKVTKSRRWKGLRWEALKRDNFCCVKCQSKRHLEIDHIRAVKEFPEGSYLIDNLQTLCKVCHSRKTREEIHGALPPEREQWRELILSMR